MNYRSHPMLLEFTSNAFYGGKLVAKAKKVEDLISWNELPNKNNFPCVFYGIEGEDMREGDSPSFFNQYEASTISTLIKNLLKQFPTLTNGDIGVISPYYKQSEKIRILLRKSGFGGSKFIARIF
jgi:helicase MOV-10